MNSYKYTLEKYNSSGSGQPRNRYTCPSCKRTRCFTRYVDTATGAVLDPSVGKCDHENRCGYHYTPAQFFRDHPSRRPDGQAPQEPTAQQAPAPPTPPSTIDWSYLSGSHSPRSGFVGWLARRFPTKADALRRVYEDYHLGATRDGGVIFWQIDTKLRIRTGKIMHYDANGHRTDRLNWVHSLLQKQQRLPPDWSLRQCLFGEHLLGQRPADTVCLVESEKTALIAALFYPQHLWLATGGCGQLSADKLTPLRGRQVKIWPDSGAYEKWRAKLEPCVGVAYTLVSDLERYPPNTDLADLILGEA